MVKNVFVLGSCAPIVGAQVLSYQKEEELLQVSESLSVVIRPYSVVSGGGMWELSFSPSSTEVPLLFL